MNEKKYIIYLDILGFKALAKEMAEGTIFEEDRIRQDYLSDPLKKKIEEIKRGGILIPKGISEIEGSDNYVLIVDNIQTAFEFVGKLTTIKIPHRDCEFIPLEVALGTKTIDADIKVNSKNRKEVISFLKEDIINPYRNYYENENNGDTIKKTFVLFTQEFFDELDLLDKKYCKQISHNNKTFFVADLERIRKKARISDFLEKIGYEGSNKLYGRIDEVYVPPSEYEDIERTLKERRIVFITGTQEYGKTYTAVRLMWEYYNNGYEPKWIEGGEQEDRREVRRKLENMSTELKPGRIIYFEDPFGKTKYEKREDLERGIGTTIDAVRQVEDVYVIITSREEVFKEFKEEKIPAELEKFEEKLNIKRASYDYERRKRILLNWAEAESCKWLGINKLKESVLKAIEDKKILPTPLSIKDFAMASAKAFAKEIKNMTKDKILFLSFPFISEYFEIDLIKTIYQELKLEGAWGFERVLNWFKDDKINIGGNHIGFSHPSYSEALPYLLVEDGYITPINEEIFSKLLFKLAEKDEAAWYVVLAVAGHFNELPDDVRNKLLFKLAEKDETAWDVAWVVAKNFDKLPEDVRDLLFKLAEKDETAQDVAVAVAYNFNELPDDVKDLLFKLVEKDETAQRVVVTVAYSFNELPDDVRNKLLFKLVEKDKTAWAVAWAVAKNFNELPDDVRNKLLFKLAEKDGTAWDVAWMVAKNFDKLPDDVRNKLLFKLAENDGAARYVAEAVAKNFDKLPDDVRDLLFKLAEKGKAAEDVAWMVAKNFDKLPENVKNLLDKLQKPLQHVIKDLSNSHNQYKEEALELISNTRPKLDQNFVLKILREF